MADDRDLIDDLDSPEPAKKPAPAGKPQPAAKAAGGPDDQGRRNFLIGAAAGGIGGIVAGAGIAAGLSGQGGSGGTTATTTGGTTRGAAAGEPMASNVVSVTVNGIKREVYVRANQTLAEVIRQDLNLTGTKIGCNFSECSACTVLLNGVPVNSCSELAIRVDGKEVTTIEGLEKDGKLSPVQEAFAKNLGFQCGFCTPGQILQATALLKNFPNPTEQQIMHYMAGNLCKCSAYPNIMASVKEAAKTAKA